MNELRHAKDAAWTITVVPGRSADSIAATLRHAGWIVEQVLDTIGVLIVRGSEALAEEARRIEGVADVSKDISINVGPPDSEVA